MIRMTVSGWNASIAQALYRTARLLARGDEAKFREIVVKLLEQARLPVPRRFL